MKRGSQEQELRAWAKAHWGQIPGVAAFEVRGEVLCVYLDDRRALEYLPNAVDGTPVVFIEAGKLAPEEGQGEALFGQWQETLAGLKASGGPAGDLPTYIDWLHEEGYLDG